MLQSQLDHFNREFLKDCFEQEVIAKMDREELFRDFTDSLMEEVMPVVIFAYRAGIKAHRVREEAKDEIRKRGRRGITLGKLQEVTKKIFHHDLEEDPIYTRADKKRIQRAKQKEDQEDTRKRLEIYRQGKAEGRHEEREDNKRAQIPERLNRFK